jgi:GxxExxY protein
MTKEFSKLSNQVIGAAIEVHKHLGPGLLESTYQQCLAHELKINNLSFTIEQAMPIIYKGIKLDCGYRTDLIIENKLIVELKSVESLAKIHEVQILSYMKLANIKEGLLINFNVSLLKEGLKSYIR